MYLVVSYFFYNIKNKMLRVAQRGIFPIQGNGCFIEIQVYRRFISARATYFYVFPNSAHVDMASHLIFQ